MIRLLLTRRTVGGAAAALALAIGGASVAWACAQIQPTLTGPDSGPSGSQITLVGRNFAPGPVEVHWNSRSGQLLGTTQGPEFSVSVTIPQAANGVHYIKAYPTTGQVATKAFEVTPAPTSSPRADGSTGTTSTASGGTDEEASSSTGQSASAGSSTATSGADNSGRQSNADSSAAQPAAGAVASAPSRSESTQGATREAATTDHNSAAPVVSGHTAASVVTERRGNAASSNPAVVTTPEGQAVFGGSSAPASVERPSTATASGDTWSGFAAPAKPSLLTDDVATSGSAPSSGLGMGIGLLGAGLVALFGGFAAAESARKRALAGADGRR